MLMFGNDSRMKRLLASRHRCRESLNIILPKASSFTCWFSSEHESPRQTDHSSQKEQPIPWQKPVLTSPIAVDLCEKSLEAEYQITSIPERHTSRFYHQNPDVQAQLERVSQSEQMALLSKHLRKQKLQGITATSSVQSIDIDIDTSSTPSKIDSNATV
ncbi:hypothetical protein PHYBLDRAFT_79695 [Phycomyces blakesleeanus NRRL 1555(-)]|uniref:Uncharacterized protein n=1 Tax=Phycomyces blakesleeanus (strain ATCC 8743b / DSM 1359 / FGSC 10004 / NBRC 33097 / NRRL 1555) TaxID=763407 RepID=A0A162N6M3_PHYB8|nr:hypothetical protein PHYBLDRAFT_79695 [Phycomyces blakesleeanus NRRL 1555(-)]OAD71658.1 hypothetical protein PHYBLDRAFT_79695 [Phycomyces blakesleeanus NRRL 1555(-)]|eukprot:XP_018289698.1 hypothetical protein PHYBLDRAFT_79695 [Phycomyces blakesleeanus NRRL 1555(-)]